MAQALTMMLGALLDTRTTATFEIDFGAARAFIRLLIDEYEDVTGGRIQNLQLQACTAAR